MKSYNLPVVKEAVAIFEQRTGIKVISGRAYTKGSMRPYVQLVIAVPHQDLFEKFYTRKEINEHILADVRIQFLNKTFNARKRTYDESTSTVDINWTDLGMKQPF